MKNIFLLPPQRVEILDEDTIILSVEVPKHVYKKLILGGRRIQGTLGRESDGSYTFHPHYRSSTPRLPMQKEEAVARAVKTLKRVDYPSIPLLPGLDIFVVPLEYNPVDLFMSHFNLAWEDRA